MCDEKEKKSDPLERGRAEDLITSSIHSKDFPSCWLVAQETRRRTHAHAY